MARAKKKVAGFLESRGGRGDATCLKAIPLGRDIALRCPARVSAGGTDDFKTCAVERSKVSTGAGASDGAARAVPATTFLFWIVLLILCLGVDTAGFLARNSPFERRRGKRLQ
jgi:hypothetical protein